MIKFEKVSFEEFAQSCVDAGFQFSADQLKTYYDNIELPTRGTRCSCGYDLRTPIPFTVLCSTGYSHVIPLGIRVTMPDDMFLMIVPRSGIGFKTGTRLANTCGIIDSDYYYAKNQGHIKAKFVPGYDPFAAQAGDRILQGIFLKYYTVDDDNVQTERVGGFGSTNK